MIPWVVPPLSGLSVLITRPEGQTAPLASSIARLGGEPIEFPTLCIEPVQVAASVEAYDWICFLSVNAVRHGAASLQATLQNATLRVAAIGKATAAALESLEIKVDVLPDDASHSEGLLAQLLPQAASRRVLIVSGEGGRRLLQRELSAAGATVHTLEVYRRRRATPAAGQIAALETHWQEQGIGVVTATSVDALQSLTQILSEAGNRLLRATPLLTVSERIRDAATELGLRGECLISRGPDDESLAGTLAYWRSRAR